MQGDSKPARYYCAGAGGASGVRIQYEVNVRLSEAGGANGRAPDKPVKRLRDAAGIKFLRLQILVSRKKIPVQTNGGIFMKATGIVRRIDGCVIIGQSLEGRINAGFSLILSIQQ